MLREREQSADGALQGDSGFLLLVTGEGPKQVRELVQRSSQETSEGLEGGLVRRGGVGAN